jgi:hypothetical protein
VARIRTIKPEFWTDEVLVQLPFEARLLFIGLWNFADDHGAIEESAERIQLQVFPGDGAVNVGELLDLLVACSLLERLQADDGRRVIQVRNWSKHQKVDNPSRSRILGEGYRKLAIPSEARRAVATKYGCKPGEQLPATCYFCGAPGAIHWVKRRDGRPSWWVAFAELELDHLQPEADGGPSTAENLVLSCRPCNRSRRDKAALPWLLSRTLASSRETSPSEGKGREKEKEGNVRGARAQTEPAQPARPAAMPDPAWLEQWQRIRKSYPDGAGRQDWIGAERLARRLADEGAATTAELLEGVRRYAAHCAATGRLVLNPSRFFGDPDRPWSQAWPIPLPKAGTNGAHPLALAAWDALIASDGASRQTDPRAVAGCEAIGGWLAVKGRTDRNARQLRDDFCRAWSAAEGPPA